MPFAVFKTVGSTGFPGTVGSIPAHFRHLREVAFYVCKACVSPPCRPRFDCRRPGCLWQKRPAAPATHASGNAPRPKFGAVSRMPHVALCLAASMDGRIAEAVGGAPAFTSAYDRRKLFRLRAEADLLLVGAGTVRHEKLAPLVRDAELVNQRVAAGRPQHPAVAIVSRSLDLPWQARYFTAAKQRLFVLTERADPDTRALARERNVTLLEAGDDDLFTFGLAALAELGFAHVLAEGGGTLVHALLARDLVDRFYLTLAPLTLGRDTPPLVNGPRLEPAVSFDLHHVNQVGSELHLEYHRR